MMKKRILSVLLAAVLLVGMVPMAFAAEADLQAHWAQQAVDTLNGIYGEGVFAASDEPMTAADAVDTLAALGHTENIAVFDRGNACTILAKMFHIPTGDQTAIAYLYDQNIINGTADDLDENGTVTKAQFAVLTYRVLNFVGGGLTESTDVLKPGTEEYFAWMYLAARRCVPFDATAETLNDIINSSTIKSYDANSESADKMEEKTGEAIWNAWVTRLNALKVATIGASYEANDTLISAAVKLVKATGATEIFTDVEPDDWWYDGVMYLFDQQIISGQGDGSFGLSETPRYQLAVLLNRIRPSSTSVETIELKLPANLTPDSPLANERIQLLMKRAIADGYMIPASNDSGWWEKSVTTAEAVYALLKQANVDLTGVNTAILERFTDCRNITDETRDYLAYAVSHGLINGTSSNILVPEDAVTRGQIGVLAYRVLIGLDTTKMQDYVENVNVLLEAQPQAAMFRLRARTAGKVLTLREDWRLTSDLDLAVPEGEILTIDGQGKYHIYELPVKLRNSGLGVVQFTEGTILYPAEADECTTEASNQLMLERQPRAVTVDNDSIINGAVAFDAGKANPGDTVTLTVTPDRGYVLDTLTVTTADGTAVLVDGTTFTMPDGAVTVTATFRKTLMPPVWIPVIPEEPVFTDVQPGDWYYDAVTDVYQAGLMTGMEWNRFGPEETVTRAQLVTILWRLEGEPMGAEPSGFSDNDLGSWYGYAVEWAAAFDIVEGADGKCMPGDPVTREQFAAILYRYTKYKGNDVWYCQTGIENFTDAVSVSDYAVEPMQWAIGAGLMEGADERLMPQATATRAQAAAILSRFLNG